MSDVGRSERDEGQRVRIEPATAADLEAILEVMRPANMDRLDSPEMPALELDRFFLARRDGRLLGAAGWTLLDEETAKTTLLAVVPEARGSGAGSLLQRARMEAMAAAGARRVITNADRPATISWYCRHFGYRKIGTLAKTDSFGDPAIDHWTTLEAPLPLAGSERRAADG